MILFEKIYYFFKGIWYPIKYENYLDTSWNEKRGVRSYKLYFINLKTGKIKKEILYGGGFLEDNDLKIMQIILKEKITKMGLLTRFLKLGLK